MAGQAAVKVDDTLLSRLDQRLYRLEQVFALLSGIAVFALMVLAVVSVSGRNVFNNPLAGYVDIIEQIMPLIAFMGVAYVQRDGSHIRMDIVVGRLRGRPLWVAEFITTFAILVVMAAIVWGSWSHFLRSFDFAAPLWSRDSSIDIFLPLWPAKLLAPCAFFILCIRLILQLWGYALALLHNSEHPVAIPIIEDAVAKAQREAEIVSGGKHDSLDEKRSISSMN